MPIYNLQCKKCLYKEEKLFPKYESVHAYLCPVCGSLAWTRRPTRTSWSFKEAKKDER